MLKLKGALTMREQAELVQCAETLREMYDEFTQSVQDLGNKANVR